MNRKKNILKKIDLSRSVGLELGPLHRPILTKDICKVFYVDHMSTLELRKKYEGHPFDLNSIADVDHVIGNNTLKHTMGNKKFDFVVASHVIEHIPNIVAWLEDVASVLKPGGILSLVIPDMRYTFDIARWPSRPSEIIGAYLDGVTKSTSSMIYDAKSEFQETTPQRAWIGLVDDVLSGPSKNQLLEALNWCKVNQEPGSYVDIHCYTFTPNSFMDIIRQLICHDLIDFEIAYFKDTDMNELEFFVSLRRISGKRNSKQQLSTVPRISAPKKYMSILLENDRMRTENIHLHEQIRSLQNSKSWKLTRPIRQTSVIFKKIRKHF